MVRSASPDLCRHLRRAVAGVTIDDWIVDDMTASNAALYRRPFSTDDIVRGAGFFHVLSSARIREAPADYFREMS